MNNSTFSFTSKYIEYTLAIMMMMMININNHGYSILYINYK